MFPERSRHSKRVRGFSVAAAVFLLVVLAALAAFLLTVGGLQQTSSTLDLQGTKVYQAARAGIEWGVYQALRNGSCVASSSFALPGALSEFTVTVQCTQTAYDEISAGATPKIYSIVATACNRPSPNCPGTVGSLYVERQLQATVDKP